MEHNQTRKFPYVMAALASLPVALLDASCNVLGLALIWKYILEVWAGGS